MLEGSYFPWIYQVNERGASSYFSHFYPRKLYNSAPANWYYHSEALQACIQKTICSLDYYDNFQSAIYGGSNETRHKDVSHQAPLVQMVAWSMAACAHPTMSYYKGIGTFGLMKQFKLMKSFIPEFQLEAMEKKFNNTSIQDNNS